MIRVRRSILAAVALAVGAGGGVGVLAFVVTSDGSPSAVHVAAAEGPVASSKTSLPYPGAATASQCIPGQSSTLAYLAKLTPGASMTGLSAEGVSATLAGSAGQDTQVVVESQTRSATTITPHTIETDQNVNDVTPILAQSSNLKYRSCMADLSNSTADQQLMTDASPAFMSAGPATSKDLSAATWMVSDDPYDSDLEIVTAEVPGPPLPPLPDQPSTITVGAIVPYMAFIDPQTNDVEHVVVGAATT
jgi:hypothetical protein